MKEGDLTRAKSPIKADDSEQTETDNHSPTNEPPLLLPYWDVELREDLREILGMNDFTSYMLPR